MFAVSTLMIFHFFKLFGGSTCLKSSEYCDPIGRDLVLFKLPRLLSNRITASSPCSTGPSPPKYSSNGTEGHNAVHCTGGAERDGDRQRVGGLPPGLGGRGRLRQHGEGAGTGLGSIRKFEC